MVQSYQKQKKQGNANSSDSIFRNFTFRFQLSYLGYLLFDDIRTWVKEDGNSLFDAKNNGSTDGAEVCELVELFLLNKMKPSCLLAM